MSLGYRVVSINCKYRDYWNGFIHLLDPRFLVLLVEHSFNRLLLILGFCI